MSDSQPDKPTDRIPRGAIAVVIVGLFLTLIVIGLDIRGGGSSAELAWTTNEKVKVPPQADLGKKGSFQLTRTTLSAIPTNGAGELVFRFSGLAVIDSGGKKPTQVKCKYTSPHQDGSTGTTVARTPNLRAAWPRPSDELQAQEVPESLVLKFNAVGNKILGVPIRDSISHYTNSKSPTVADWGGYQDENHLGTHAFIWDMAKGTGPGPASLGYAVVFKTVFKPELNIRCDARVGNEKVTQRFKAIQQEWPIEDQTSDSTVGSDPKLDVE